MLSTSSITQDSLFVHSEWFPSEMRLLQPPEDLSTAEWAERYRYVVKSIRPGPWRNSNNPPLIGIMNAADRRGLFRNTRVIVVRKGVQTGVTEVGYNIIFKQMDSSPQNILLVMESERKIRDMFKQLILPTIKKMPRISGKMSHNPDDITNSSIMMANSLFLKAGYGGSQGSVASGSYQKVIIDEADKYTDPTVIEEAKDRNTVFAEDENGLVFIFSTPGAEGGPITREFENCDTVMDFYAECPECAALQVMDWEHFTWPGKGEPLAGPEERKKLAGRVMRDKLARYICNGCGVLWDDYDRDKAVRLGTRHHFHGWKLRDDIPNPASVAIDFPSWISPFKSLSHVVSRWLRSEGNHEKRRMWHNQEAAEPYIEKKSERKEDAILSLRDDRPRGVVPYGISTLLCLIDTQQRGFYYEVVAFDWGPQLESWQIREGFVETEGALEDILFNSEYKDADGRAYAIQAAFIDSGGGTGATPKHSRTAEVYDFCRRNPMVRPLKGRQRLSSLVTPTRIDYYPGTKKPIPGGLTLYNINVTYFKDQLNAKLGINPTDPGAWHLHSEASEDYARQMIAEYRNDKGVWICPQGKANHYWDLGVYRLAAAEIMQIKFWKKPEETEANDSSKERKQSSPKGRRW